MEDEGHSRDKELSTCRNVGINGLYLNSEILKVSHNDHEEVSGIRVAARWKGINSNHPYQHHWYLWNTYCAVGFMPHTLHTSSHLKFMATLGYMGLPWWFSSKGCACQCRRHGFNPWVRKVPWRRKLLPTQYSSCLGNTMDKGAWRAIGHGVTKPLNNNNNWGVYYIIFFLKMRKLRLRRG